jgi:CDGSH-type Zn-finger protein
MRGHDLTDLGVLESGYALHVRDNDDMERVVIKVRHNGPYKVTGPITLIDADDNEYDLGDRGETIVLCRCGHSGTKPFCDSSHRDVDFQAGERAVRQAG